MHAGWTLWHSSPMARRKSSDELRSGLFELYEIKWTELKHVTRTPGCLLGTIRALRACGQILFPITITYNNINSNSTLLHTNTSLDWHTLFSQGSGNLPFCMNVAVNIGSAFPEPESWPSFVYTDSRVEVAVKRLLPFVCSRFSLDAQQNKRWACISFSRVSLLASISRKLRLSACRRDL